MFLVRDSLDDLKVHFRNGGDTRNLGCDPCPVPELCTITFGPAACGETLRRVVGITLILLNQNASISLHPMAIGASILNPSGKSI